jgi:hypothetical protein
MQEIKIKTRLSNAMVSRFYQDQQMKQIVRLKLLMLYTCGRDLKTLTATYREVRKMDLKP